MITLMDPRWGCPIVLDWSPRTDTGFMYWQGELREIRDIHQTHNGTQIELYR